MGDKVSPECYMTEGAALVAALITLDQVRKEAAQCAA
jgi:hypothetical protein